MGIQERVSRQLILLAVHGPASTQLLCTNEFTSWWSLLRTQQMVAFTCSYSGCGAD